MNTDRTTTWIHSYTSTPQSPTILLYILCYTPKLFFPFLPSIARSIRFDGLSFIFTFSLFSEGEACGERRWTLLPSFSYFSFLIPSYRKINTHTHKHKWWTRMQNSLNDMILPCVCVWSVARQTTKVHQKLALNRRAPIFLTLPKW
jgi:hypothetical protein